MQTMADEMGRFDANFDSFEEKVKSIHEMMTSLQNDAQDSQTYFMKNISEMETTFAKHDKHIEKLDCAFCFDVFSYLFILFFYSDTINSQTCKKHFYDNYN